MKNKLISSHLIQIEVSSLYKKWTTKVILAWYSMVLTNLTTTITIQVLKLEKSQVKYRNHNMELRISRA